MDPLVRGFADELVKVAGAGIVEKLIGAKGSGMRKAVGRAALLGAGIVEKLIGAKGSGMRKAVGRAALLGAGTTTLQTAIASGEDEQPKHWMRNILGGGLAGAVTGRAFPAWFGRASMSPTE